MKFPRPLKWFRRQSKRVRYALLLLMLTLGGCGGILYGEYSAEQLQCNKVTLPPGTLPGAGSLKIAFFSDIHANQNTFEQAIEFISEKQPDLILFGGDLVTADQRFSRSRWVIAGFHKLSRIAPCYAVLGNHDYEKQTQVERVFKTAGIRVLRNESIIWETPSGSLLRIIGLGDFNEGDEAPHLCMKPKGEEALPVLLLSHDPESRWFLRSYDWDIMLSGHTHGGQIGNPFTGKPISFRSSMSAGLFNFDNDRHVFVTRGLGAILNMRFFCPPEVCIIEQKS